MVRMLGGQLQILEEGNLAEAVSLDPATVASRMFCLHASLSMIDPRGRTSVSDIGSDRSVAGDIGSRDRNSEGKFRVMVPPCQ